MNPSWKVKAIEGKKGPYSELADFSAALKLGWKGASTLEFTVNGTRIGLELDLNSGSVVGLIATVRYEGGRSSSHPFLALSRETPTHVEGKERGINREVQLGQALFDDAIYVDSDASDDEVRRVLARPEVRAAVLRLVREGTSALHLSPAGARAKWSTSSSKQLDPRFSVASLTSAIELLLDVSRAGPPREAGAPRRGGWLFGGSFFALPVLGWFAWKASSHWSPAWPLGPVGAALGLAVAWSARGLVAEVLRGDSGSFARYRQTVVQLHLALALLGAGLIDAINGAFDASPPVPVHGTAARIVGPDDDDGSYDVTFEFEDGSKTSRSYTVPPYQGQPVSRDAHRGALHVRWYGPVEVD